MKRAVPYIVAAIIAIQGFTPPMSLAIQVTNRPIETVWLFLLCCGFSVYLLFTKANPWIKFLVPFLCLTSFLSKAPYLSITSFTWVTASILFYLLCLEVDDWMIPFRAIFCLLIVEIVIAVLGIYGKDTLLSFGAYSTSFIGTTGNVMQYKSLIVLCLAILIQKWQLSKEHKVVLVCVFIFIAVKYFIVTNCYPKLILYRGPVWIETIRLSLAHPIIGYGIGTFKGIFNSIQHLPRVTQTEGAWLTAHNFFAQFLFEAGFVGLIAIIGYMCDLFRRCRGMLLIGAIMVLIVLSVHFPDRQPSTVPLLILFAAYIERNTQCRPQVKLK